MRSDVSLPGFIVRWLFALILLTVTFNPTGYSLFHWIFPWSGEDIPLKILACIAVAGCYLFYLTSTFRSLGLLGILFVVAFFGTLIWLFVDQGWMDLSQSGLMTWVLIAVLSVVLGLGISWSHIKKRITGQFDTDDVGE